MGSDSIAAQFRSHEFVVERQLVRNCDQPHSFFIHTECQHFGTVDQEML